MGGEHTQGPREDSQQRLLTVGDTAETSVMRHVFSSVEMVGGEMTGISQ